MRFSGHESFACRYAWLPKAYRYIVQHSEAFTDYEQAMVSLGVGKNMVRSIRFWVQVMGVATPVRDRTLELTAFGHSVFADDGFDPFLEDMRTLWLLYWKLSVGVTDPLFAWNFLINKWAYQEFTQAEVLGAFIRESQRLNVSHSGVTLGQHLDIFLHTYISSQGRKNVLEDSLDCPLAELELLRVVGAGRVDGTGR